MNNIVKLPIGQANEKLPKVKTLPTYYDDQIVDEVEACPYCGNYTHGLMCCGEVHSETLYEMDDGEFLFASEVRIIERPVEINNDDGGYDTYRESQWD